MQSEPLGLARTAFLCRCMHMHILQHSHRTAIFAKPADSQQNYMKKFIFLLAAILPFAACVQTVTLTPENEHVVLHTRGTVTFNYANDLHFKNAIEEGLENISGLKCRAGIIYDVAFYDDGQVSKGKIYNYTSDPITVECTYYSGGVVATRHITHIKPRTFMRMIPDGASSPDQCDKIVCKVI